MKHARTRLTLNGEQVELDASGATPLLDALRQDPDRCGAKRGCDDGSCGACAVLVDGRARNACLIPLSQADGAEVVTVEGLAQVPELAALQRALVTSGLTACGFCVPGMLVVAAQGVVRGQPRTADDLQQVLAGVACRCSGYRRLIQALRSA